MPLILSDIFEKYNGLLDEFIIQKSTFADIESGANYKKNILNNFDFIYNDPDVTKPLLLGKYKPGKHCFIQDSLHGFLTSWKVYVLSWLEQKLTFENKLLLD